MSPSAQREIRALQTELSLSKGPHTDHIVINRMINFGRVHRDALPKIKRYVDSYGTPTQKSIVRLLIAATAQRNKKRV